MNHTDKCITAKSLWAEERARFVAAHPNFCAECEGWGVVGSGNMDGDTGIVDVGPCPKCLDDRKCPWCGMELGASIRRCACGWTDEQDGIPTEPECFCGEADPGKEYTLSVEFWPVGKKKK